MFRAPTPRFRPVFAFVLPFAVAFATLLLPLAVTAQSQATPTAQELLALHLESLGGEAAVKALESLKIEGVYTAFSEPAPVVIHRAAPDLYHFDYQHEGRLYVAGHADGRVWWSTPLLGFDWAVDAPGPEARVIYEEAFFLGPLAAAALGYGDLEVTLGESEDFDGEPAHELVVDFPDGTTSSWFVSRDTHLAIGRIGPASDYGRPMEGRTWFSDYRPVANVQIPYLVESEYGIRYRVTEVETIVANQPIEAALFAFPAPRGMEDLSALAGTWNVASSYQPSPRRPAVEETTTATMTTGLDGAIVEESIVLPQDGANLTTRRTLSYDRQSGTYQYLVADANQPWHTLLTGTRADDGSISLSPAATGDQPPSRRVSFRDLTADSFKFVTEITPDGGETWLAVETLSYTRRE